jgi:hypothetical protein
MIAAIAAGSFVTDELMLRQPREGLWRARIRIATNELVEGEEVTLSDDAGNEWVGVARAAIATGPTSVAELVGGAGQLDALTTERYYAGGVSIASVLSDLCADVGETPDTAIDGLLAQWRTRGGSLRGELSRLAQFTTGGYRIVSGGSVSLSVASGEADLPGRFIGEASGCRTYEASNVPPLAGLDVDGWTVGVALWERTASQPLRACLWRSEPSRAADPPAVVGGRVTGGSGGRVDVMTDTGVALAGLPLWSVAGVVPEVKTGGRVLVLDIGGDPRATIALAGAVDTKVTRIDIGGESDSSVDLSDLGGRALRYGDTVMMPLGVAGTPTPTVLVGPPFPVDASKVRP